MRCLLFPVLLVLTPFVCLGQAEGKEVVVAGTVPAMEVRILTPQELVGMLGRPDVLIYDCNEADMFAEAHVPGARLTVYDEVSAEFLPADRTKTLVFYCYSPECPAGMTAANTALKLGYANVYCMVAGITGWQDAGLRTEP